MQPTVLTSGVWAADEGGMHVRATAGQGVVQGVPVGVLQAGVILEEEDRLMLNGEVSCLVGAIRTGAH